MSDVARPPSRRVPLAAVSIALLVVAVSARLAIVFTTDRPMQPTAANDEGQYFELARNILAGRGMSVGPEPAPTAIRTPGYPLALAAAFAVGGPSVRAGLVVGALADGITAMLVFLLAMRLTGSMPRACIAGFAWAMLSPYLWWMNFLYPDPVGAMLIAAAVLASLAMPPGALPSRNWGSRLLPRGAHPGGPSFWMVTGAASGAAAGLAWALAVLTRPIVLVAAIGSLLALRRRVALMGLVAFTLGMAPWVVRNAVQFERLIPLSTGGTGMNLWVGTWNDSRSAVVQLLPGPQGEVGVLAGPYFDTEDERVRGEAAWNAYMDEFLDHGGAAIERADADLRSLAIERIRNHPWRWLRLRVVNVALAWTLPDMPSGRWIGAPTMLLALLGFVALTRAGRWRELLILVTPIALLAMTLFPLRTEARYVANVAPLIFALAACAGFRAHDPLAAPGPPREA